MNPNINEYREAFLQQHGLTKTKVYASKEETEILKQKYNSYDTRKEVLKEYKVEDYLYGTVRFYKEVELETNDEEISQFITFKTLELMQSMEQKQNTIKNIMIFWVTLTIISLVCWVYFFIKVNDLFTYMW